MAVYKVPQDVEADDKLIGPFSFRQFIFLLVMVGFLYFTYLLFNVQPLLSLLPFPFVIFFAALAFPWRKDQPTEVYLAALIHFWTRPRKRIWNQEGHVEHVIVNAPKKVEHTYSDGLSNTEVRSRLHSLAQTLDTRGWAAKNVSTDEAGQYNTTPVAQQESDRLVMPKVAPVSGSTVVVTPREDVFDVQNNPIAQNFDQLVNKATEDHKAQLMQQMSSGAPHNTQVPEFNPYPQMHQHVVQPHDDPANQPQKDDTNNQQNNPVKTEAQGAIMDLANNSDLNVSTIARQAEQAMQSGDTIDLH